MSNVLIDSDVLLDFFFDRKPYADHAAALLSLCEERKITGFITPVILSNTYYLLRKFGSDRKVRNKLIQLLSFLEITNTDKKIILKALHSDFKDFEDALQNFSAEANGKISVVITRNLKDYRKSELNVMSPYQYLEGKFAGN